MTRTAQNVTKVAVYHHRMQDPDDPSKAHPIGVDLGMGYDFVDDRGVDIDEAFPDAYYRAGAIGVKTSEFDDEVEAAGLAYEAWEMGAGHDQTVTRSMAVGDILVVEGGDAYFVDRIGFEKVDVTGTDPVDTR